MIILLTTNNKKKPPPFACSLIMVITVTHIPMQWVKFMKTSNDPGRVVSPFPDAHALAGICRLVWRRRCPPSWRGSPLQLRGWALYGGCWLKWSSVCVFTIDLNLVVMRNISFINYKGTRQKLLSGFFSQGRGGDPLFPHLFIFLSFNFSVFFYLLTAFLLLECTIRFFVLWWFLWFFAAWVILTTGSLPAGVHNPAQGGHSVEHEGKEPLFMDLNNLL